MKKTILIGVASSMLFLSYLLCRIPVIKADLVSSDGYTIAYQPYVVFPSNYATYDSGVLTLNVSFHGMIFANTQYSMTYSLDGKESEVLPLVVYYYGSWIINPENWESNHIDGSVILPELSDGSHRITVYLSCDWESGNQVSTWHDYYYDNETVYFIIKTPFTLSPTTSPTSTQTLEPTQSSEAEPFPTTSILAVVSVVAIVSTGSIIYFKKRERSINGNSA